MIRDCGIQFPLCLATLFNGCAQVVCEWIIRAAGQTNVVLVVRDNDDGLIGIKVSATITNC
jgi:hypothetical protein